MFILYDKPVEDKSIYDNKALHNLLSMRLFREASYRFIQPFTEIAYEAKICNVFNGIYVEKRDFMLNLEENLLLLAYKRKAIYKIIVCNY